MRCLQFDAHLGLFARDSGHDNLGLEEAGKRGSHAVISRLDWRAQDAVVVKRVERLVDMDDRTNGGAAVNQYDDSQSRFLGRRQAWRQEDPTKERQRDEPTDGEGAS
jgi:hypothetical protein